MSNDDFFKDYHNKDSPLRQRRSLSGIVKDVLGKSPLPLIAETNGDFEKLKEQMNLEFKKKEEDVKAMLELQSMVIEDLLLKQNPNLPPFPNKEQRLLISTFEKRNAPNQIMTPGFKEKRSNSPEKRSVSQPNMENRLSHQKSGLNV